MTAGSASCSVLSFSLTSVWPVYWPSKMKASQWIGEIWKDSRHCCLKESAWIFFRKFTRLLRMQISYVRTEQRFAKMNPIRYLWFSQQSFIQLMVSRPTLGIKIIQNIKKKQKTSISICKVRHMRAYYTQWDMDGQDNHLKLNCLNLYETMLKRTKGKKKWHTPTWFVVCCVSKQRCCQNMHTVLVKETQELWLLSFLGNKKHYILDLD